MDIFVRSLLEILRNIPNINLIILDPLKKLRLNPKYYPNYFMDDFGNVLLKLTEFIENLIKNRDKKEGILVGISSGAAIYTAIEIAKKLGKGKKVLALSPDGGEKYISMGIYD